jgi:hypothetical protein
MRTGPINSEIVRKRGRELKGRNKLPKATVRAERIGAHCAKGNCPGCYVLACSCDCHRRNAVG